jgi:hypothetical protein
MAFKFHKSLLGAGAPPLVRVIIDNSDTITLGDMVKVYNAGNAEVATAARPLFGPVHAVVDANGLQPTPDTGTVDTWTVASDNETVALKAVLADPSIHSIYSATVTGTINTTATSGKMGVSLDLDSEAAVLESSAARNAQGQLYSWGPDPADSTRLLVSIMESETLAGGVYS